MKYHRHKICVEHIKINKKWTKYFKFGLLGLSVYFTR